MENVMLLEAKIIELYNNAKNVSAWRCSSPTDGQHLLIVFIEIFLRH